MSTATALIPVRLARRNVEADGIASFELVSADGRDLPAFTAGSHIDVVLGEGLIRQYSLCNPPSGSGSYLLGVLLDPASRGGSRAMHALKEGDVIQVSAPRNHFGLAPGARRSLLLAGGIGVTPILCMAEQLATEGADFEMHYCARSISRTAFVSRIREAAFARRAHLHFDDGDASQAFAMDALLAQPQPGTHLYVCGPRGFMDAVLDCARRHGWPETQIHYEFFAGAAVATEGDAGFTVKLARSGTLVPVASGQTIAQALTAAGVPLAMSCEQGVCGTCMTRVLDGTPDHRDMFMTPDEQARNDQITPCCSRSKSPLLVLDL
ncbi:MAG: PDR/VanB family oxidoreductase [Gammaproteobacteria bacterium]|jgi:vanillate monooxygenase ferredoxin subunit|nr:PDR/VanB family oxidoreductase [Gammaproteobacteria bacterium]MBU0773445.1 PDR/VanB family oxidoreductase [Gammaproteobacteria bacterium]MBU0856656.1 PDR/VanB family oxidoreductase [Gammaproteobacteria bacterium]MBU1846814.1 PDR/VanB family oxidoreductase [Gammaproteobacteria bacterium]